MARTLQLDGVQFESVRKAVDQKYADFHDALSDAYYNYWKKGLSKPVGAFDKAANPAASKTLFDQLHAAAFWLHEIALVDTNTAMGDVYPSESINPVDDGTGKAYKTLCQEKFNALPKQTRDRLIAAIG